MASYAGIDNFDSYSDGNLHGANGGSGFSGAWSGNTDFDVQGAVTLSGAGKAVTIIDVGGAERAISRSLSSSIDSGDLYFAFRKATSVDDYLSVDLRDASGSNYGGIVQLGKDGGAVAIKLFFSGGLSVLASGLSLNTWYIINVNFVSATQFKVRWKAAGGTWSAFDTTRTYDNSVSSPQMIRLREGGDGAGLTAFYVDAIGTSDPDSASVTVSPSVLAATFSQPAATVTAVQNTSFSASPVAASLLIPAPTVTAVQNATVTPPSVTATFSIPAPIIVTPDVEVTPRPVVASFSTPSPTISAIQNVEVLPLAITATLLTPTPTVSVVANVSVSPSPITATFVILTPRVRGGLWENEARSVATLTNQTRSSTNWTNESRTV